MTFWLVLVGFVFMAIGTSAQAPAVTAESDMAQQVLMLRAQLQQAKTELIQAKANAQTFERRWRGCEAAADQDLQAKFADEWKALQSSSDVLAADQKAFADARAKAGPKK